MALFRFDANTNKLVPITSEGNIGLPVGAVMAFADGTSSENWLLCDGRDTTGTAEELQTHYPALYTYLGNSNILPEKYETLKDTRVIMTVNAPNSTLSGSGIQIENASHVTSIEVAGATRSNQHNLARLAVDLTTATSLLFGFGGSDYTITINGTYNSTNDTWDIISNTNVMRGLFINYDELGATETRHPLYIKATSAGIEVDKDLYATKGYVNGWTDITSDWTISYSSAGTPTLEKVLWRPSTQELKVIVNAHGISVNADSPWSITITYNGTDQTIIDMKNNTFEHAASITPTNPFDTYMLAFVPASIQFNTAIPEFYAAVRNVLPGSGSARTLEHIVYHITL